jgi:hypothetical protein
MLATVLRRHGERQAGFHLTVHILNLTDDQPLSAPFWGFAAELGLHGIPSDR